MCTKLETNNDEYMNSIDVKNATKRNKMYYTKIV